LAHSADFFALTFVIVSREIFFVRLFCAPRLLLPPLPRPPHPLTYATDRKWVRWEMQGGSVVLLGIVC